MSSLIRSLLCAAVAMTAVVAGCTKDVPTANSSSTNSTQQPALSASDAQSISEAVSADMEGELEGASAFATSLGPLGFGSTFGSDGHGGTFCMPTISPMPIVNSDGDRVPDSIRVTFPDCTFGFGHEADTVRGSIDLIDPTPKITDKDVKTVFDSFARIEVVGTRQSSILLDGTREALRDSSMISQTETNFKTIYTFFDNTTTTHMTNWATIFTADVKGSIHPDAPLPAGTLSVNGMSTLVRDTSTYALTVSTNAALHYNPTCTVRPKFDSGTIKAVVTKHGATTTVTVAFTACGQYMVTRS